MEQSAFRIGEVAARAEVSVDTVRYYERLKLLPRARRSSGGFRLFDESATYSNAPVIDAIDETRAAIEKLVHTGAK